MTKKQLVVQVVLEGMCILLFIASIICLPGYHFKAAVICAVTAGMIAGIAEWRRRKFE